MKHYFRPGREDFRQVLLKAMPKMLGDGGQKPVKEEMREIIEHVLMPKISRSSSSPGSCKRNTSAWRIPGAAGSAPFCCTPSSISWSTNGNARNASSAAVASPACRWTRTTRSVGMRLSR
jgi:hypothetical protein